MCTAWACHDLSFLHICAPKQNHMPKRTNILATVDNSHQTYRNLVAFMDSQGQGNQKKRCQSSNWTNIKFGVDWNITLNRCKLPVFIFHHLNMVYWPKYWTERWTCSRTTFTASIEARADRSLGQTKANLHSVVHVRLTETVRILRHCKPTEKGN